MKPVQHFCVAAIAIVSLMSHHTSAEAAVLFNNGASDLQASVASDYSSPSLIGVYEAGDDFNLSSSATITQITWSGIYFFGIVPSLDNFSVRLFNFANGLPEINPFVTLSGTLSRADSGLNVEPDATLYNYALTLTTPFNIEAGRYLLAIANTTTADPNDDWGWATSNMLGGNAYLKAASGEPWQAIPVDLAFAIEGNATPIPTPALLPGLIALSASVLRQRKKEAV